MGVRKAVTEGRWQGWKSRTGKAPSYPEQYFIDLFHAENVEFERELKSNSWKILRIRWFNPRTAKGKSLLYPQIEQLKRFIGV